MEIRLFFMLLCACVFGVFGFMILWEFLDYIRMKAEFRQKYLNK